MALTTIPSELSSVSGISDSSTSTAITINSSQEVTFAGNITTGSNTISGVLASAATATTQAASDNSTKLATTAYVTTALANLVDSAPGTLNTLNELAAALGDDANFSTTVTNSIATKLPLAGGTMTGDLILGDNVKLEVGSASGGDLQIYHDGSNSYIAEAGTGSLKIGSSDLFLQSSDFSETMLNATANGAVTLYYDNSAKLATTSTGINVAGTGTFAGGSANNNDDANILTLNASQHARLLVDTSSTGGHRATLALESNGNETTLGTTGSASFLNVDTGDLTVDVAGDIILDAAGNDIIFKDAGTTFGQITNDSTNIIIYNAGSQMLKGLSSGSDAQFMGKLTVGSGSYTNSQYYAKDVVINAANEGGMTIASSANTHAAYIMFADGVSSGSEQYAGYIEYNHSADRFRVKSNGTFQVYAPTLGADALTVLANGNIGIGASSPNVNLEIMGSNSYDAKMRFAYGTGSANSYANWGYKANSDGNKIFLSIANGGSAADILVAQANGNVGIGTDSPTRQLDIENSSHAIARLGAGTNSSASLRLQNDAQEWDVNLQTNDKFAIYDQTSAKQPFTIMPTTNHVGVGTATPVAGSGWNKVLHVHSPGAGSHMRFTDSTTGDSGERGTFIGHYSDTTYVINRESGDIDFMTDGRQMLRLSPNVFSFGGGVTSHGRIRQYHYAATMGANTTVALLQNASGAHTDVNFIYWIEAYHSGRTYRTGVGTFGGYGLFTSSAGTGLDFTITAVSSGVKRLDFAAAGVSTTVYIGMLILGDTTLTVHNGTLGDMI